jgi:hypothetical protein
MSKGGTDDNLPSDQRKTEKIDPNDVRVSWPLTIASLDQIGDWTVFALRLGTLALIQEQIWHMVEREASPEHIAKMRELVEALAHMPWKRP